MPAKIKLSSSSRFSSVDLFPFLILLLYASVELFNGDSTSDVMGYQWFMISVLNIGCLAGFAIYPKLAGPGAQGLWRHPLLLSSGALLLLASISITVAINQVESLVVFTRLLNGIFMFLVIATILSGRTQMFRWLAIILSVLLLAQSLQVIAQFFREINAGNSVNTVIYNLKLNAANKNILAAMLVFKSCLALYCSFTSKRPLGKYLFGLLLLPASLAIFLINARASFIALILVLLIFYIAIFAIRSKEIPFIKQLGWNAGPLLAVLLGFFISVPVIRNALQAESIESPYGTVASRLSSIDLTVAGSNARIVQWKAAIDHIQHHPLMGCGIGNWKLASIPYEKETVDDLLVAYHVHNDFLELTAETGLLGGILYLAIFGMIFFYSVRSMFFRKENKNISLALFALTGLAAYGIDAVFNFPMERPVMQFYFALLIAISVSISPGKQRMEIKNALRFVWLFPAMLAIPFSYIAWQTSRSLQEQALVNKDLMSPQPQTKWQDIIDIFPAIPNMNAYTFPIEQVKALYLLNDKKYEEAMERVRKSEKVNPNLSLTEFLKARIYFETGKTDSARYYIAKAFAMKPRAKSHFDLYTNILYQQKDTAQIKRVFNEYSKYRPAASIINDYIVNMTNLGSPRASWIPFVDSSLKVFPGDTILTKLRAALAGPVSDSRFYDIYQEAIGYFSKKEFNKAISLFGKAWEIEKQYLCLENIGLCYYSLGKYNEAMVYFEKVILSGLSSDGKSEFFKAACLINLGKAIDACPLLRISDQRNYPEAADFLKKYCR